MCWPGHDAAGPRRSWVTAGCVKLLMLPPHLCARELGVLAQILRQHHPGVNLARFECDLLPVEEEGDRRRPFVRLRAR